MSYDRSDIGPVNLQYLSDVPLGLQSLKYQITFGWLLKANPNFRDRHIYSRLSPWHRQSTTYVTEAMPFNLACTFIQILLGLNIRRSTPNTSWTFLIGWRVSYNFQPLQYAKLTPMRLMCAQPCPFDSLNQHELRQLLYLPVELGSLDFGHRQRHCTLTDQKKCHMVFLMEFD